MGSTHQLFTDKLSRRDKARLSTLLNGTPKMTPELLKLICLSNDGYQVRSTVQKTLLPNALLHSILGVWSRSLDT